jgi:hypothetical protein
VTDTYSWVPDAPVSTISLVSAPSVEEVVNNLGLVPIGREADLGDLDEDEVLLGLHDGWVSVLEVYGWDTRGLLKRLSRHDRVALLYKSVNEDMQFAYAERGDVLRKFDPNLWPDEQWGTPLPQEEGLAFGWSQDVYPYGEAVRLMERVTGLRLTDDWLEAPRSAYRYAPATDGEFD